MHSTVLALGMHELLIKMERLIICRTYYAAEHNNLNEDTNPNKCSAKLSIAFYEKEVCFGKYSLHLLTEVWNSNIFSQYVISNIHCIHNLIP